MATATRFFTTLGVESFDLRYHWLRALAWLGRPRAAAPIRASRRLHLGCGPHVLPGWANLDLAGSQGSIRWHLGWRLPAAEGSVDAIFSEHFIEHVHKTHAAKLLRECFRVLRTGGVIRLSTPSLEKLVSEYQSGRLGEWADLEWLPASASDLLNEGMRSWGHQYLYDEPELRRQLIDAGFSGVRRVEWRQSGVEGMSNLERRPFHDDLILEATK